MLFRHIRRSTCIGVCCSVAGVKTGCVQWYEAVRAVEGAETLCEGDPALIYTYNSYLLYRLNPSGHYMYHQFNIHKFYVLPAQCIYVFCVDLRTISDYFPVQH